MKISHYRSEIDGMRAIAILSVVVYHLNKDMLPGGFIGVDIFFVISGFLITSQIHADMVDGRFSVRSFYKRRINRILPALFVVLAASLVVGFVVLSPHDLSRLTSNALYSIVGFSNIYLWREYGNYFADNAAEAVLLHTWSLGVEEQFYLLWPLFLIVLLRFAKRYLVAVLWGLTIAAVALSEWALGVVASASFYLLPMRLFELMIGGVLAISVARGYRCPFPSIAAWLGVILISYSLFALNGQSPFPGLRALIPCVGGALLIWSGSKSYVCEKILSAPILVFIGLISYSLYLWHWPIIAYLHYIGVDLSLGVTVAVSMGAVLLSWLTWKYIEVPMRKSGAEKPFRTVAIRRFVMPFAVSLVLAVGTSYFQGFPVRFDPKVTILERMALAKPEEGRAGCHVPIALYRTLPNENCVLGAEKDSIDGILIGDSFANHFTGMVDVLSKPSGLRIMDFTMNGCPPILGFSNQREPAYREKCIERNESAFDFIETRKFGLVILAGSWPHEDSAGSAVEVSIGRLVATGAQVVVILANEKIKDGATCPVRRIMFASTRDCEVAPGPVPRYWSRIRSRFPQVMFIDPNQIICDDKRCSSILKETLLYRDNVHLNVNGSRLLGEVFLLSGLSLNMAPEAR